MQHEEHTMNAIRTAEQQIKDLFPLRKSYRAMGDSLKGHPTQDADAAIQLVHNRRTREPYGVVQAMMWDLGLERVDACNTSERWNSVAWSGGETSLLAARTSWRSCRWNSVAWSGCDGYRHPTKQQAVFLVYTPYGGLEQLDIVAGSKNELEELRQMSIAYGLRPQDKKAA
jgi:hypothetical protein